MSNINKPAVKPILLGKKIILKPDKVPTIGSDSLVTSGALAEALQNKNVALNDSSDNIIPTGDIIIGRLGEDSAFYIINPNFLGTKWMKLETLKTGKLYYDKFTHTYYTFQGYIVENEERVGYKFEPLVLPSIVKVTWQELKDLRDNSKLIPGLKYRITDYQCTTTQENTQSAGHQFDIVLLALSEDKLAEEGWAMMHDNIYDITFYDGVTKKCYVYKISETTYNFVDIETLLGITEVGYSEIIINEEEKTILVTEDGGYESTMLDEVNLTYNYFQNSNLSAWKVWYCLDNDTSRFAWADDSEDFSIPNTIKVSNRLYIRDANSDRTYNNNQYYAWDFSLNVEDATIYYTLSENPEINDVTYQWQQDLFSAEGVYIMHQQPEDKRVSAVTSGYEGRAKEAIITCYDNILHNNLSFKRDTTTNNGVLINNGITYYTWIQEGNLNSNVYTLSEYPKVGDSLYHFVGLGGGLQQYAEISSYQPPIHYYNGRGVIYRLIDEWNNDVPYDFKNILIYNETYSQYCYAVIDNTENNFNEDPTLDGTKVKAIHVLCDNNDVLKPVAKGGFGNNPLVNVIFLNNNTLADEYSNCVVSNGVPI